MNHRTSLILGAVAGAISLGCSDKVQVEVTAMTRNVYVGADIEQVLTAQTPADVPVKVEEQWQALVASKPEERARAIAGEIVAAGAQLVGLQEISLLRTQSPGDAITGGTTPAETVVFDYLQLILDALQDLGESYSVAAKVENFDLEMPRANATFDDVRLTDFDVILARNDVTVTGMSMGNYTSIMAPLTVSGTIEIKRGWALADVTIGELAVKVVNTHLESAALGIRIGQGQELLEMLSGETGPILLVGDLNSDAAQAEPVYASLIADGFSDTWTMSGEAGPGYTCCHSVDLASEEGASDRRIDLIMLKQMDAQVAGVAIVGDTQADKMASGIWPSDHFGYSARILIER